jgi:hypothetical protein
MTTTLGLYQCLPSNANPASIRVHILNGKSVVLKIICHDNVVGDVNVDVCVWWVEWPDISLKNRGYF